MCISKRVATSMLVVALSGCSGGGGSSGSGNGSGGNGTAGVLSSSQLGQIAQLAQTYKALFQQGCGCSQAELWVLEGAAIQKAVYEIAKLKVSDLKGPDVDQLLGQN